MLSQKWNSGGTRSKGKLNIPTPTNAVMEAAVEALVAEEEVEVMVAEVAEVVAMVVEEEEAVSEVEEEDLSAVLGVEMRDRHCWV